MNCIHKDHENGWCKLHSDWSSPMPVIEYCVEGPCPDEKVLTNADRIWRMSDEELAKELTIDWLKQPAKKEHHEAD